VSGMALGRQPVDRGIVMEVSSDFDLQRQGAGVVAAPIDEQEPVPPLADPKPPVSPESPSETVESPQPRRASWRGFGFR
jgi:hypothetical protein